MKKSQSEKRTEDEMDRNKNGRCFFCDEEEIRISEWFSRESSSRNTWNKIQNELEGQGAAIFCVS